MEQQTTRYSPYNDMSSLDVPRWLAVRTDVSPGAKLTYGRLRRYAGRQGYAFPRQRVLAAEVGVSIRQLRRYTAELAQLGLIETEAVSEGRSNRYYFVDHPWRHEELGDFLDGDATCDLSSQENNVQGDVTNDITPMSEMAGGDVRNGITLMSEMTSGVMSEMTGAYSNTYSKSKSRRDSRNVNIPPADATAVECDRTERMKKAPSRKDDSKLYWGHEYIPDGPRHNENVPDSVKAVAYYLWKMYEKHSADIALTGGDFQRYSKRFKCYLKVLGSLEEVKKLIDWYLDQDDKFYTDNGYSLGILTANVTLQKYQVVVNGDVRTGDRRYMAKGFIMTDEERRNAKGMRL